MGDTPWSNPAALYLWLLILYLLEEGEGWWRHCSRPAPRPPAYLLHFQGVCKGSDSVLSYPPDHSTSSRSSLAEFPMHCALLVRMALEKCVSCGWGCNSHSHLFESFICGMLCTHFNVRKSNTGIDIVMLDPLGNPLRCASQAPLLSFSTCSVSSPILRLVSPSMTAFLHSLLFYSKDIK